MHGGDIGQYKGMKIKGDALSGVAKFLKN